MINSVRSENQIYINFEKMSHSLGLHKDSLNYLGKMLERNEWKGMSKLKQLYKSIEPVEEEEIINQNNI